MFLFKASGRTFDSVIAHQKHALHGQPAACCPGDAVLLSKNKADCRRGERQIEYLMVLESIRPIRPGESEFYWPNTENRWRYMVSCRDKQRLRPFEREQALGGNATRYATV